jgi:hypothetical protein
MLNLTQNHPAFPALQSIGWQNANIYFFEWVFFLFLWASLNLKVQKKKMRFHPTCSLFLFHFWVSFYPRNRLESTKTSITFLFFRKWIESFDFRRTPGQTYPLTTKTFHIKGDLGCVCPDFIQERLQFPPQILGQCFCCHLSGNYGNSL